MTNAVNERICNTEWLPCYVPHVACVLPRVESLVRIRLVIPCLVRVTQLRNVCWRKAA